MHQPDVTGATVFRYRLTDDDLEIGFSIFPIAHIAAVEADHDAAFRNGQPTPVRWTAINETRPLLLQLGFDSPGDTQGVFAQRGGVGAGRDRQDVGEQPGRGGVGHE